ncbi:MarR family winged helix-turn-helix transcriptional regulator [Jiella pacifica]|uniref:MarR family transcriptional regulator n=1 Tax=Jiella pacifica TaxID=2696469 RepID=A0A6N9T8X8_9HYPH|nr:MarR family winged helix-turn-helix transcriptional regulator [Jiella pacifica]NDW07894.1 MarR family transcriptional regulator [Jiella pacifica]
MSNRNDSPADPSKAIPFSITIKVRDNCLCLHSQRAARAIARRFDEAFRPLDLKSGQFSILMSLNRPEPPTLGAVADLLGMDRTTLTANLKPLERRGLLQVSPDEKDRRLRRLSLTEAGRDILHDAVPLWEWTQAELETALGIDGDPDRLRVDLNSLA